MRVLLLICLLYLSSCSLFVDDPYSLPSGDNTCDIDMDINGEPWSEIHPDDEAAHISASSNISDRLERHEFEGYPMKISCNKHYQNQKKETLTFNTVMPEDYSVSDLASHKVDFQNPEFPERERVSLWEWEYDFGVASYETDTTQTAYLKITDVDTVKERFTGEFELTLYANENNIDSGRLPDTLQITNGQFEVEYNDSRE